MRKYLFVLIALFMVGVFIILYTYIENKRFELHTTQQGVAYKIDRRTGKTWIVAGGQEKLVKGDQKTGSNTFAETSTIPLSKEDEQKRQDESDRSTAIVAAQISYVFEPFKKSEDFIRAQIESLKEPIKSIIGWNAYKAGRKKYYVTYVIETAKGEKGWVFEVLLTDSKVVNDHIVRLITGNQVLEKEYFDFLKKKTKKN